MTNPILETWWCRPEDWGAPDLQDSSLALLNNEERQRLGRFRFDDDRERFLVSHALKRRVLEKHSGIPGQSWSFVIGDHGRPEPSPEFAGSGLRFNLSHTFDLVACVLHGSQDCGIDVEHRQRKAKLDGLMRRCFTPQERLWIGQGDEQRSRFFKLWTLKEAYIKARGMGMALPLQGFWFLSANAEDGRLGFGARSDVEEDPGSWFFELQDVGDEHQMALASRVVHGQRPEVVYREATPAAFSR